MTLTATLQLDRTQQARADLETEAGRAYVVRYVVTYINRSGLRALAHAAQGRCTYDTPEAAEDWIRAALANNTPAQLADVYRDVTRLAVRAAACYPGHHDPIGIYFDDDRIGARLRNLFDERKRPVQP